MKYFKKKYRDIAMRAICDYDDIFSTLKPKDLYSLGLPQDIDADGLVEVLCAMGLVTYKMTGQDGTHDIRPTNTGRCYFERQHDLSRKEKIEWVRYAITTVIALAAFLKSFFF